MKTDHLLGKYLCDIYFLHFQEVQDVRQGLQCNQFSGAHVLLSLKKSAKVYVGRKHPHLDIEIDNLQE